MQWRRGRGREWATAWGSYPTSKFSPMGKFPSLHKGFVEKA